MELKENEVRIYYKVKGTFLLFEKELKKLFEKNGYKCWASGFGLCDGVRDLCFEKKKPTAKMIRKLTKELENNEVDKSQNSTKPLKIV